jgi:hypothetical protein
MAVFSAAMSGFAKPMRALNYIPLKSRKLLPGGRCGNTVVRGWTRPVREVRSSPTMKRTTAAVFTEKE